MIHMIQLISLHNCVCLSEATSTGVEAPRSMRLMGTILGHEVLVLVNSGSSHTFLISTLGAQLSGSSALDNGLWVKVANGATVCCSSQFKNAQWEVQGYEFTSDFKVIFLQHIDIVLGYDWLEKFSPMKVHWSEKWMAIPYGQFTVVLHGILSKLSPNDAIQIL
jgi:hypothetical protein